MLLSISLNIFEPDHPAERAAARCKQAGFDKLDLNYWGHMPTIVTKTWREEEEWAHNVRAAADAHHMGFTQTHGPVAGHGAVAGLRLDEFMQYAERSLRTAAILNAPWVVFHPIHSETAGYETYTQALQANCQFYSRLLPLMESTGVGIALENMICPVPVRKGPFFRSFGAAPEQLAELIDKLNHPLFGACWDTGHGHMQGVPQGDALRILGSRLKTTHIQDNDATADQHLLPYLGTIDWNDVMKALHDIEYAGDFTYETHTWFRKLPDELRDTALRQAVETGNYLLNLAR